MQSKGERRVRIILCKRHFGEHKILKEINVDCKFSDVYLGEDDINEELLLSVIPKNFLPTEPKNILLVKIDEDGGGTAQRGLNIFKNWSKYYDAYVLHIGE